jgi:hypothetical protein
MIKKKQLNFSINDYLLENKIILPVDHALIKVAYNKFDVF